MVELLRRVTPAAVRLLDAESDRRPVALHLLEDVVGGDQHHARRAVRSRVGHQETGADRPQPGADRLLEFDRGADQIDGDVHGHAEGPSARGEPNSCEGVLRVRKRDNMPHLGLIQGPGAYRAAGGKAMLRRELLGAAASAAMLSTARANPVARGPGRVRPGDAGWPSEARWSELGQAVGGRLSRPAGHDGALRGRAQGRRVRGPDQAGAEPVLHQRPAFRNPDLRLSRRLDAGAERLCRRRSDRPPMLRRR